MCGSMIDTQCATAEIRRGIKEERKKKPQDENIMAAIINCKYQLRNFGYVTRALKLLGWQIMM